jgi:tetratricopeptide (TPR) repeat protein
LSPPARESPYTLATQAVLAWVLKDLGRLDEAERLLREVLAARRKLPGRDDLDLAGTLAELGSLLTKGGRAKEAEPLLRECLAIREKKLPSGHWRIAAARSLLGGSLAGQEKFGEAEPLLLAGYEAFTKTTGAPAQRVAEALDRVIELYEKWGKPEQAEAWRKKRPAPGKP